MSIVEIIILTLVIFNIFQMFIFENKMKKLANRTSKAFSLVAESLERLNKGE